MTAVPPPDDELQLERPHPDYADALAYIASLPFDDAEADLKKYGKALVTHLPEPTTELLMKLCTGCYEPTNGSPAAHSEQKKSSPENYVHLFADRMPSLRVFLDYILSEEGSVSAPIANTLLELLLREWDALAGGRRQGSKAGVAQVTGAGEQMMSDPLAVSSSLVEASPASNVSGRVGGSTPVGESEGDGASTQSDLASRAALKAKEEEVMNLLRSERVPYDKYHALVLVEVHNFKAGQLYLYERLARGDSSNNELGGVVPSLLLEHYAERADVPAMLRMCRREPDLWAKVLQHVVERVPASGADVDDDDAHERRSDLQEALRLVEQAGALPPLQVLRIVSLNDSIEISEVQPYITGLMRNSAAVVQQHHAEIDELRTSTAQMRSEIHDLRSSVLDASETVSRASLYFAAAATALPDSAASSSTEHRKWEEIKKSQQESAGDHEQFFKDLEESNDGFEQVAGYFGRGRLR